MKEKLESNIEATSGELRTLDDLLQKAEEKVDEIRISKGEVRDLIQKNFDEIRKALDEKEATMLKNVEEINLGDESVNDIIFDIHKEIDNFSEAISAGNELLDELDTKEITTTCTSKAASIINKLKDTEEIRRLKSTLNEKLSYELLVRSDEFVRETAEIIQSTRDFPEVEFRKTYTIGPTNLSCEEVNPFFVSLEWDKNERDDKYIVFVRKEGKEWSPEFSLECSENKAIMESLCPDTTYNFRVKAKRGTILSNWSDILTVKTTSFTFENVALTLFAHCDGDNKVCLKSLEQMKILTEDGIMIQNHVINTVNYLTLFHFFSPRIQYSTSRRTRSH